MRLLRTLCLVVITTAIGAGVGFFGYALKPTWKAEAHFDKPTVVELGNYYTLFSTYSFLNGGDGVNYHVVQNEKGAFSLVAETGQKAENRAVTESYDTFKRNLLSPDVLSNFLMQTETAKLKAQLSNQPVALVAQELAKQFSFQPASQTQPFDVLSVSSESPEEANKLLTDFLLFANQQTKQMLNAALIAKWKILFQQVKNAAEMKLGAMQQGNQIASQDWNGKLNLMRSVQPLDDKLVAFQFAKAPSVPLSPDHSTRVFWLLIGAVVGFSAGVIGALMISRTKRKVGDAE